VKILDDLYPFVLVILCLACVVALIALELAG
jgi:hypothetical protein